MHIELLKWSPMISNLNSLYRAQCFRNGKARKKQIKIRLTVNDWNPPVLLYWFTPDTQEQYLDNDIS